MSVNTIPVVLSVNNKPLFMDTFIASGHLIFAFFGIPFNVTIISFIIFRRRLRRQPRILIWIGIGLSNIFFLCSNILEPIGYYYSTKATELCHIHFFLVGFPGASFLMHNFLSLVDRYICIFHSVWYRRYVTTRLVLGIQLAAFIVLFFLMKSHYIFGLIQVKCNVVPSLDRTFYIGFILFFLILCLSGQLTFYMMLKKHLVKPSANQDVGANDTTTYSGATTLSSGRIIQPGESISARPTSDNNQDIISPEQAVRALGQRLESRRIIKLNLNFVRIKYQIISRLELEATLTVILSVGIFLLFCLPWIISSVSAHICIGNIIQTANMSEEETTTEARVGKCSRYYWAISYSRLIYLMGHFMYQFFFYVLRRKDFCAGLSQAHIWRRNEFTGTRNRRQKRRHRPPQRMRTVHRPRYNRMPTPRLRFDYPAHGNGEPYVSGCP